MRKTVSFGTESEVPLPRVSVDNETLWYSKTELIQQKQEGKRLAKEHKGEEESDDGMDDSFRGLEQFQDDDSEQGRRHRHHFVQSLLALQSEMKEMNVNDPQGIQAFARAHSSQDCKEARRRGKSDAAIVGNKGSSSKKLGLRSISPQRVGATCA
ncbi:expressed unknown protein [Seminavis robusta]|uniref:Uncharacterized protein n=1 Tax=Seminavis robusta TaxID=568900 RepID=A0A9N8E1Y6_9STRA|nr:expressed unknown protein [Seminavis robusta]|eukprot:Sro570_g168520.1 n/a (155) ;mRNA; r:34504-34968